MPEETEIITTEYLRKIEVALNIPSGHTEISPAIRLAGILQAISRMSNDAGYVLNQYKNFVYHVPDYLDMEIDFQKQFPDDPEGYEAGWDLLHILYTNLPDKKFHK